MQPVGSQLWLFFQRGNGHIQRGFQRLLGSFANHGVGTFGQHRQPFFDRRADNVGDTRRQPRIFQQAFGVAQVVKVFGSHAKRRHNGRLG